MAAKVIEPTEELLAKLKRWYDDWDESTQAERAESEKDRDYYDGIQWTDAEIEELKKRGQPALTFNRIAPKINYILGDEILKRVDPKAYPRTPAHEDAAEACTDMLRYIDDAEDFDDLRSTAFEDMIVEGVCGAVVEVEKQVSLEPIAANVDAEPANVGGNPGLRVESEVVAEAQPEVSVKLRHVPWDRLFWDPHSRKHDFSDARYLGVVTWMDRDEAEEFYPGASDVLEKTLTADRTMTATHDDRPSTWADSTRDRVKIVEVYWRTAGRWYVAHLTGNGFVRPPRPTGYLDETKRDECPLHLASCFIDRRNRRYGLVRSMRSPQDEINKRRSKALHRLNTNQVIAEDGAVPEPEEARVELAKPDGWVTVNPGGIERMQIRGGEGLANIEFQLLAEAKAEIDANSTLGQVMMDPSSSGRSQLVRQKAASVPLEKVHDRLRHWTKAMYSAMWHRVKQFITYETWLRVRDDADKKGYRFVGVNRSMTRSQRLQELLEKKVPLQSAITMIGSDDAAQALGMVMQGLQAQVQQAGVQVPPQAVEQQAVAMLMQAPFMSEFVRTNELDRLQVDIIIEETPDTTVLQQEEYQDLVGLAQSGIQLPPQFVELVIEASGLRNKKRLLEMLRQAPDPEQQQEQAEAKQIQKAMASASVAKTQAEAQREAAAAAKTQAEIPLVGAQASRQQAAAMRDAATAGEATAAEYQEATNVRRR